MTTAWTEASDPTTSWNTAMEWPSFMLPLNDLGSGQVDTAPVIGSAATFTRTTTATTVDSAGTIVSVASGVARSYYDPTTLEYMGYLAEGARTNLCLQSEDLNTTWTKTGSTVSINVTSSPDGGMTSDKLEEDSSSGAHGVSQSINFTTGQAYTFSVFAKAGERSWISIVFPTAAFGATRRAFFNLGSGSLGTVETDVTATIKAYPNGWYRCTATMTATATAAGTPTFRLATADVTDSYTGAGGSPGTGAYFWGFQVEVGSFASSYIPTTTASVTRNADVLTYAAAGNMNVGTSPGTAYCEAAILGVIATATRRNAIACTNAVSFNRFEVRGINDSTIQPAFVYGTGSGVITLNGSTLTEGTINRLACSYGPSGGSFCDDGGTVQTSATASDLSTQTGIGIGVIPGGSSGIIFGTIKNVRIWTSQLSDIAALTL